MSLKKLKPFFVYIFALLYVTTAIGKLLDNRGFAAVLETYQLGLSGGFALVFGLTISLAELVLGVSLFLKWNLRRDALIVVGIQAVYLGLASVTLWRGIALENCGCFGVFLARPLTMQTIYEDAALLLLAVAFLASARRT